MSLTALGAASMVAPWLAFNAHRGVSGLTPDVGYVLNVFANKFGFGETIDLLAVSATYTSKKDRELVGVALRRFASDPSRYLRSVVLTAEGLLIPVYPEDDVAPYIGLCRAPPFIARTIVSLSPAFPEFTPAEQRLPAAWRCEIHTTLMPIVGSLITIGWIGLIVWSAVSLRRGRFDLALLASVPLACVLPLCLMLQANTRYAFPCEAIALGIGVPAGAYLVDRAWGRFADSFRA